MRRALPALLALALAAPAARPQEKPAGDAGAPGAVAEEKIPTAEDLLRRADEGIYVFAGSGARTLKGRLAIPGTSLGRLVADFSWKAPAKEGAKGSLQVRAGDGVPEPYHPLVEKEATRALESFFLGRRFAAIADEARLASTVVDEGARVGIEYTSGALRGLKATLHFDPATGIPARQVLESPTGATITDTFRFEKHGSLRRLAGIDRRTKDPQGKEHEDTTVVEWVAAGEIAVPWRVVRRGQLVGVSEFLLEAISVDGVAVPTPAEKEAEEKPAGKPAGESPGRPGDR